MTADKPGSASPGHRARKRFGQNFLRDEQVIARILAAISARAGEHVVEIGPGLGALTKGLADALGEHGQLSLVELDRDLAAKLLDWAGQHPQVTLYQADALDFDFTRLAANSVPLRVVGNLPYNISTPLLFHLLDQHQCHAANRDGAALFADMHFMLQREVVERICAAPGSKTYGRLSVMMQYYTQAQPLFDVPPEAFEPRPAVESAILRIQPHTSLPFVARDTALLGKLVTAAFAQRRKTLRNTLKNFCSSEVLEAQGIDPGCRAETLQVADFVNLANALAHEK